MIAATSSVATPNRPQALARAAQEQSLAEPQDRVERGPYASAGQTIAAYTLTGAAMGAAVGLGTAAAYVFGGPTVGAGVRAAVAATAGIWGAKRYQPGVQAMMNLNGTAGKVVGYTFGFFLGAGQAVMLTTSAEGGLAVGAGGGAIMGGLYGLLSAPR